MGPELARESGYQISSLTGIFSHAGTKADAIVFDAKPQFTFDSFKGNTDLARPASGKGMLHCIRNELVDDQTKRHCLIHTHWKAVGSAFNRNLATARHRGAEILAQLAKKC